MTGKPWSKQSPAERAAQLIVDMEQVTEIEYLLGRLLAITEQIAEHTIGHDAAADLALQAFEQLHTATQTWHLRLVKHATTHLPQVADGWRRDLLDGLLTQVAAQIGADVPGALTPEESALFVDGYYHQRGAILAAALKTTRQETEAAMEAAKAGVAQLVAAGMTEVEAAERLGVARMTARTALGK